MSAKEIKELRQSGKLKEAYQMASDELKSCDGDLMYSLQVNVGYEPILQSNFIWAKRNLAWVIYEFVKQNNHIETYESFITYLTEISELQLPSEEKMLFEQLSWQIGKMAFSILRTNPGDTQMGIRLFESIRSFHFPKPSEGSSFLFKAFHKALKDTDRYTDFADWWGFDNFLPKDFQKEKMPNGKEVMSIVEQAYIAYAKHLLPKQAMIGEVIFDKEKALAFLPILSKLVDDYPQFQYPAYFNAKLLLAVGDNDNVLGSLIPFAKKKRNDFWVWEILAEAFSSDADKVFACYCKALSCKSPEEMLVSLRQRMAGICISKELYNEAKTEIELLVAARNAHGFKIPFEIVNWQSQDWYKNSTNLVSNATLYNQYTPLAESLLFYDIPEEPVIVEFVNSDKKVLNFIASESKFGFFKYDRFFKEVKVGDILKVRFQGGSNEGMYQLYTAIKGNDDAFKSQFLIDVEGEVKIPEGKPFGFLGDVFIHPSIVTKKQLSNGMQIKGLAIRTFNQEKKKWGWKLI